MVRVAYLWTDLPQMPEVALELRESIGWEPVLWLGHEHLREPVAHAFPAVPWQTIADAHFCRPIHGLSSEQPSAMDELLWVRLQQYLPRLMNQMNRYGPSDHFSYDERESFARELLTRWHEALTVTGPEVAFWEESPSVPFSYAAYAVCQEMGIRTVSVLHTRVYGLSLLRERIEGLASGVQAAYEKRLGDQSPITLPENVQEAIQSVLGSEFRHVTQVALDERERRGQTPGSGIAQDSAASGPPRSARLRGGRSPGALLHDMKVQVAGAVLRIPVLRRAYFKSKDKELVPAYWKMRGVRIDAEFSTLGESLRYQEERALMKQTLKHDYERRCSPPDYERDQFIYFPLHYRPERTSNPDGGVFYDQVIPLAMVSEALPEGWKLYVKEHGVQFYDILFGECGRTTDFYDEIAGLAGVQFISTTVPSKDLVMNAAGVASITGTVCWEAALLKKPAMYFGFPWYIGCPGTVRVTSAADVRAVVDHPMETLATDDELQAWHQAVSDAGFDYQFNAWQSDPGRFDGKKQAASLRDALQDWYRKVAPDCCRGE